MAYIPGHNKKQRGIDSTARGPARWERAARNALRNPHSKAAAIYRDRVGLAYTVSSARRMMGAPDHPWQFIGPGGQWAAGKWVPERKRMYATCSAYCTVLQMTLEFGANSLEKLTAVFEAKFDPARPYMRTVERLDVKTLKRPIRCQVCTRKIHK